MQICIYMCVCMCARIYMYAYIRIHMYMAGVNRCEARQHERGSAADVK